MRYEKGRKETTHQHILDVASGLFRKNGVAATGLAQVMTDAGLTKGAFHAQFGTKDNLVREAVLRALDQQRENLDQDSGDVARLEAAICQYLSAQHRDNPGLGCPTSALVGEIARQPIKMRRSYTERLNKILGIFAAKLPDRSAHARRRDAVAMFAIMIGILQLARAVSDKEQSDQLLQDGIEAALNILKPEKG